MKITYLLMAIVFIVLSVMSYSTSASLTLSTAVLAVACLALASVTRFPKK